MTLEQLAEDIIKDFAKDGEVISKEDALEMAKMEMGAKEIKNYTQAVPEKKEHKPREKKIDEDKKKIIEIIAKALTDNGYGAIIVNVDKQIDFGEFTVNLVKHRPPKK